MRYKYLKLLIIPLLIFIVISGIFAVFLIFSGAMALTQTGKNLLLTGMATLFIISLFALVASVYTLILNDKKYRKEEFIKKAGIYEDFYNTFYEYAIEKTYNAEILSKLKKEFTFLSVYLSDRVIKLFNDYFIQTQDFELDHSLDKKEIKQKRVTFEQCVVCLRHELGLDVVKCSTVQQVNRTRDIFTGLELKWFDWNKNKIWFFEMCRDHGNVAMEYMRKHNLIFIGGGPKSVNANVIKQIKKDDIILAHKYDEGYVAIGVVTVDTKTIIWPKDNPLLYNDGEIRVPVRWSLFLNIGVNAGYTPTGLVTRILNTKKALTITESLYKRANEAGNEFNSSEVRNIIENLKSRTRLIKPRIDRKI